MADKKNIKTCINPECTVENPEFYPSRPQCKVCFHRTCYAYRKNKQKGKDKIIEEQSKIIEDLQETIQLLSEKLSELQV